MESRITISFDYEQSVPFIKIHHKPSEDERDRMVQAFLNTIPGEVCFAKFQYEHTGESGEKVAGIRPISFESLPDELKTMQAWVEHIRSERLPKQVLQYVPNTSPEFLVFLEQEHIYHEVEPEKGCTGISGAVNLFNLGVRWGEFKTENNL